MRCGRGHLDEDAGSRSSTSPRRSHGGPHPSSEPNIRIVIKELTKAGRQLAIGLLSVAVGGAGRRPAAAPATAATTAASTPTTRRRWPGRRAPLAALHEQANELLPGGVDAFEERIAALQRLPGRGQRLGLLVRALPLRVPRPAAGSRPSTASGSPSSASTARTPTTRRKTFLEEAPVPYPSYSDPDEEIADEHRRRPRLPATAFYDRDGELVYLKQGPTPTTRTCAPTSSATRSRERLRKRIIGTWTSSSSSPWSASPCCVAELLLPTGGVLAVLGALGLIAAGVARARVRHRRRATTSARR